MDALRRIGGIGAALAAALTVVGCDEGPQTLVDRRVDGVWSRAQGAMIDGPLPIIVQGQPFERGPAADAALGDRIVAIMTEAVTWTATPRFTSGPAVTAAATATGNAAYGVVMTFNGRDSLSGGDQCEGRSRGGGPLDDGRLRLKATFCAGATTLVTVSGRVAGADGPDSERFAAFIRQVTLDMLTPDQSGR